MVALSNRYFHKSNKGESKLLSNLVKESIKIMGRIFYYIPRDVRIDDLILGEDVISHFPLAISLEMYQENANGFSGDREMLSKFGLTISNNYKLVVHKDRWEEEIQKKFTEIAIDVEDSTFGAANYLRPREGDLIYDPINKFLFEIKFVDHDDPFYQLGHIYQYTLSCESFQYQNENINTGIPEIDLFQLNSRDILDNVILLENGACLVYEQEGYAILDLDFTPIRPYGTDYTSDANSIDLITINPFQL